MIEKVKNRKISLSWTEVLVVGMPLLCLFTGNLDSSNITVVKNVTIVSLLLYLSFRLSFSLSPLVSAFILLIIISFVCLYECGLGFLQLIGDKKSNHYLYAITGSFQNPGPYGGFLAICISLLVAYYYKTKGLQMISLITKLSNRASITVAVMAIVFLPSTQSRSAILALGCSMILLAFGTERIRVKIKPILKKYGLWLTLGLAIIGTGAYLFKKPSADGRLFMDKICIKAMCDNGWKGAGIGHFGGAYGKAQASYFKEQIKEKGIDDLDWRAINEHDRMTADCPDNAFNEYLFIGVEAGPIVMLLFIGIIVSAIIISFKRGTIWCYGMTAFAVFALFSYPLHVKQFQIIFPIILAACVSDRQQNAEDQSGDKEESFFKNKYYLAGIITMVVILISLSTFIIVKLPEVRLYKQTESAWKKAERWHKKEYYEYVVEDCDNLLPYMKHDYRFLFAYGQSLNKTGNYEKSDAILRMGTEISSDPMFWNVMGNNSLALGKYREAEDRYKHAFYMVPNRLYPLYLLAKLYHEEGDTAKFMYMAEKIASFPPKIKSTNTEQLCDEIKNIRTNSL
jgi:tetratricopeptide (TPR) repeat protein